MKYYKCGNFLWMKDEKGNLFRRGRHTGNWYLQSFVSMADAEHIYKHELTKQEAFLELL